MTTRSQDFVLMVSEQVSPQLHSQLVDKGVRAIEVSREGGTTHIKTMDQEWTGAGEIHQLLKQFLRDNPYKMRIHEMPQDVNSSYRVSNIVTVEGTKR